MERKNWTLLVLDAARPGSLSPLQLQKILFLMSKRLPDEVGKNFYHFVPYNYGPFDPEIYDDVRSLVIDGLAERVQYAGRNWTAYAITNKGHEIASQLETSERASQYITRIVQWVMRLTFTQLLASIYKEFPEFKVNSVF